MSETSETILTDEPSANVSALAAELCRKHNDADRVAVWEIHDVEALIRRQFRESTPSPVIEGNDREAELLKQLAIVQGERDELAKHFYDARLIASNHAEHVSRLKQKLAALEDERDWMKTCTNTRAYGKLQAENDQLRTTVTSLREACEGAKKFLVALLHTSPIGIPISEGETPDPEKNPVVAKLTAALQCIDAAIDAARGGEDG